jgi:DNA helicase-4
MNAIIKLLITAVLIFSGVLYYRWNKKKNRKKKELFEFFKSKLDTISKAKKEFSNHLEYNTGYFSNNQLSVWLDKFNLLYLDIKDKKYENIHLEKTEILIVKQFLQYYIESSSLRLLYNKNFIKEELEIYKIFFNNIEGKKLDTQQRTAIISNEDNNLVVAGAGSGKTTTIVGKINYLIDRYDTKPNDILLISFTKKSADELASRINLKGLKAKTFHKFGIDVISSIEKKQPSIFDEKQFKPFIIRTFKELLKDENYIIKVIQYDTATRAFRQYKPDFTINPKGDRVYLEHFAKNKNGTVPEWFADESKGESQEDATRKYNDGIKWKRKIHKKYSTTLLESYSYDMYDGKLFI